MTRNWRKQPRGCWWSFSPGFKTKTKPLAWILEIETDKKKKHIQISGPFKILVTSPRKKFIQIFWQKSAKKWIKFFWKMSWNRLTGERLFFGSRRNEKLDIGGKFETWTWNLRMLDKEGYFDLWIDLQSWATWKAKSKFQGALFV